MLSQPSRPSGVLSNVTPVRPPPCHISSGYLPLRFFGRKYCTYICSTMNWPFGSSFDVGPPGTRWISRTSLPLTSAMRAADVERAHAAQHDVFVGSERRQRSELERDAPSALAAHERSSLVASA